MSALRSLLFCLLVVFAVSCSTHEHITFRIDPSWSSDDAEGIRQSAREWNAYTVEDAQLVESHDGEWLVQRRDPMIDYASHAHGGWLAGHVDRERHIAVLLPADLPGWSHALALHEFGHVIGFRDHTRTGVMRPTAPSPAELVEWMLTDVDVAACQRIERCGMIQVRSAGPSAGR